MTSARSQLVTAQAPYEAVWRTVNDVALWPSLLDRDLAVRFRQRTADGDEFEVVDRADSWVISHRADPAGHRAVLRRSDGGDQAAGDSDQLTLRRVADGVEIRWEQRGTGCGLPVPLTRLAADPAADPTSAPATDPVSAARALAPEISSHAVTGARAGTVPAFLTHRLRTAGLFGMALPESLGGSRTDFPTIVTVVEELSRADAATGWHVLIGNTNAFLAWLEPAAAKELVGGASSVSLAGSTAPAGQADVVAGDRWRVSGRWPFCSGALHADLLMVGFRLPAERARPDRRPDARVGFFPAGAGTILGTWRTMGLEATGSHDIALAGLEIPDEYTAALYYEPARQDGEMYRLTPYNILMVLLAGLPLGVARRAIDETTALAENKTRAGSRTRLIEDPEVIMALLDAESSLRAARCLVLETVGDAWRTLAAGGELDTAQRTGIAMATGQALRSARAIVTDMFRVAGASVLRLDHPLQQCLRDLHVAAQHFGFSDDLRLRYARTFLGLASAPALYQV